MLKVLNDEEIADIVSSCKEWYEIPGKVSKAQHQVDLKAFTELLESHKFHDDYGGESAMIYRDSLVESLKQMVELEEGNDEEVIKEFMDEGYTREQAIKNLASIDRGMTDVKTGRVSKIDMEEL